MMLNCFFITVFFVVVIDQLHFVDEVTTTISGWMTGGKIKKPLNIKPFSCSTCSSWWVNLVYIILTNQFSIPMVLYIVGLSWTTPIINSILSFVKNVILKVINIISNFFDL